MSTLLDSCFAAARRHLAAAKVAQKNALIWGLDVYKGGCRGERARMMRRHWHRQRAASLEEALRVRRKIHELRAQLRRLELDDTIPPRSAA